MTPINFEWKKFGKLFLLKKKGWTHSSHPCINKISESICEIYFASRDTKQRSHIFKINFRIDNDKFIKIGNAKKVLSPGKLGYFDNEGCITVNIIKEAENAETNEVHGFPTSVRPHNAMYDIVKKLPLFTKSSDSKSLYCAGYYTIKFEKGWVKSFCPKLITLQRYEYRGPMKTELEMKQVLAHVSAK